MFEFSARGYVEISYTFGQVLASLRKPEPAFCDLSRSIETLLSEANRLGLVITRDALGEMLLEIMNANPGSVNMTGEGDERKVQFTNVGLDSERTCHHVETIYATMKAELGAILLKAIPRERATYCNSEWLKNSEIESKFPTSFTELDRAAICYSLGQSTASVFHSMRALEPALAALAKPFPHISSKHENWQTIIEQVETTVRALGQQPKSQQKLDEEKFFGAATSHLYFVKNAWRNHVAHARDSYNDDEALKILIHTFDFIESLCPRLQE
jgi:hypothetical protein